jgi:hypothetical protein
MCGQWTPRILRAQWVYHVTKSMLLISHAEGTDLFCGRLNILRCFRFSHLNSLHFSFHSHDNTLPYVQVSIF